MPNFWEIFMSYILKISNSEIQIYLMFHYFYFLILGNLSYGFLFIFNTKNMSSYISQIYYFIRAHIENIILSRALVLLFSSSKQLIAASIATPNNPNLYSPYQGTDGDDWIEFGIFGMTEVGWGK